MKYLGLFLILLMISCSGAKATPSFVPNTIPMNSPLSQTASPAVASIPSILLHDAYITPAMIHVVDRTCFSGTVPEDVKPGDVNDVLLSSNGTCSSDRIDMTNLNQNTECHTTVTATTYTVTNYYDAHCRVSGFDINGNLKIIYNLKKKYRP